VQIIGNDLTTTIGNNDLILEANGAGIVNVPNNDVLVSKDLTVLDTAHINIVGVTNTLEANAFDVSDVYITGNTITTTTGSTLDLQLKANGSGKVHVTTADVEITNDLAVVGLTTTADVVIGDSTIPTTASLSLTGDYLQTGTVQRTGNTNITGHLQVNGANTTQFQDVRISNNVLSTTIGNNNLVLEANGTGIINIPNNNVLINHNLAVDNTAHIDTLRVTTKLSANEFTTGNVSIVDNYITTTAPNWDLELFANDSAKIEALLNSVDITNSLEIGGSFTVLGSSSLQDLEVVGNLLLTGNINQTGNTYLTGNFINNNITVLGLSSYVQVPNIKIQNNKISGTATDADLSFVGLTTGGVKLDQYLTFKDTTISNTRISPTTETQKSIFLTPNGTGNTIINTDTALTIPSGNNSTRTLSVNGEIRFNSTFGTYEGYDRSGIISFSNIYSNNRNTYITPELTAGANDNIIRFGTNGTVVATISTTALKDNVILVDNVSLANNTISNVVSSNDLTLETTGSGVVNVNGTSIVANSITSSTDSLTLTNTGTGYVKFAGKSAIYFPYGPTSDRRPNPEIGESRYNSDEAFDIMEVWDGNSWIPAVGTTGSASLAQVQAEIEFWTLILG
jgi:hypothetical protein